MIVTSMAENETVIPNMLFVDETFLNVIADPSSNGIVKLENDTENGTNVTIKVEPMESPDASHDGISDVHGSCPRHRDNCIHPTDPHFHSHSHQSEREQAACGASKSKLSRCKRKQMSPKKVKKKVKSSPPVEIDYVGRSYHDEDGNENDSAEESCSDEEVPFESMENDDLGKNSTSSDEGSDSDDGDEEDVEISNFIHNIVSEEEYSHLPVTQSISVSNCIRTDLLTEVTGHVQNEPNESTQSETSTKDDKDVKWYPSKTFWWRNAPERGSQTPNIFQVPKDKTPFAQDISQPVDSFHLFITKQMIDNIVIFTNLEGRRSKGEKWTETTGSEVKALIGCLLYCGSMRLNATDLKMLFDSIEGIPLLRVCFFRNRFASLLNHLRFDDKQTRQERHAGDPLAPIREVWDSFLQNLQCHYVPGARITIGEQLIPFRGKCSFLQYRATKQDKNGLKILWATDSDSHYPLNAAPYLGKMGSTAKYKDVRRNNVLKLVQPFMNSGRNITVEDRFTDLELADRLSHQKLTLLGEVKRRKLFLPSEFKAKARLEHRNSLFGYKGNKTLVSYQSKRNKNVIILSTMHTSQQVDSGKHVKPDVVIDYDVAKGSTEVMDKMVRAFSVKRKTKRWPMVYFCNILDLSILASRVVWKEKHPHHPLSLSDKRCAFIQDVAKSLMKERVHTRSKIRSLSFMLRNTINKVIQRIDPAATTMARLASEEAISNNPLRKHARCSRCPSRKDRKSKTRCNLCLRPICKEHSIAVCVACRGAVDE